MNFKDFFFLTEASQQTKYAEGLIKKYGLEDKKDMFFKTTEPYNNANKHLPQLIKYYLKYPHWSDIERNYHKFMQLPALSKAKGGIERFKNFQQFEGAVSKEENRLTKKGVDTSVDVSKVTDKPDYEDENVKVYLGDSKAKCIKYGQGSKYGFCISRTDASNLYNGYRLNHNATFYFVYFKTKEAQSGNPAPLIVIHVYPAHDGDDKVRYEINYAHINEDHSITKEQILKEFPALSKAFKAGMFQPIPLSEEEEFLKSIQNQQWKRLNTLQEKLLWIEVSTDSLSETPSYKIVDMFGGEYILWKKYTETGYKWNAPIWIHLKNTLNERQFNELKTRYISIQKAYIESTENDSLVEYDIIDIFNLFGSDSKEFLNALDNAPRSIEFLSKYDPEFFTDSFFIELYLNNHDNTSRVKSELIEYFIDLIYSENTPDKAFNILNQFIDKLKERQGSSRYRLPYGVLKLFALSQYSIFNDQKIRNLFFGYLSVLVSDLHNTFDPVLVWPELVVDENILAEISDKYPPQEATNITASLLQYCAQELNAYIKNQSNGKIDWFEFTPAYRGNQLRLQVDIQRIIDKRNVQHLGDVFDILSENVISEMERDIQLSKGIAPERPAEGFIHYLINKATFRVVEQAESYLDSKVESYIHSYLSNINVK